MKPFMKPLYQEFEGHLYRLFNLFTGAKYLLEATGKDLDQEYEKFPEIRPQKSASLNWHILSVAVILEEGKQENDD